MRIPRLTQGGAAGVTASRGVDGPGIDVVSPLRIGCCVHLELLDDEQILVETAPHPVAFADHHLFWALMAVAGAVGHAVAEVSGLGEPAFMVACAVWCVLVGLVRTLRRISFWWITAAVLVAAGTVLPVLLALPAAGRAAVVPVIPALIAEGLLEAYRRSHRFFVTNQRLVFVRRFFLLPHTSVDAYYHHVTNLVTKQTMLERLVGAGTVIPVMSSGLNLGSEVVGVAGGFLFFTLAGGREKRLPRALPFLCFYSVPVPTKVARFVATSITNQQAAPRAPTAVGPSTRRWPARVLGALFFAAATALGLFVALSGNDSSPAGAAAGETTNEETTNTRGGEPTDSGLVELYGLLETVGGHGEGSDSYRLVTDEGPIRLELRPELGAELAGEEVVLRVRYVNGGPGFVIESIRPVPEP